MEENNIIWTEKYRPHSLSDVIGHENIVSRLKAFVKTNSVPHCLFAGPAGIGKTTCAIAIAKDLYGKQWKQNFLETNASDERGIDVVRNQIKNFARALPAGDAPFKILVLDEADHLTGDAQHALRRTMESYATSCRMILICNYSSRIIPPIQSRCSIFKFSRLSDEAITERLKFIAKKEKVKLNAKGIGAILYLSEGDMRAAINLLQAASSAEEIVSDSTVFGISGRADPGSIKEMMDFAIGGRYGDSLDTLKNLIYHQGVSPVDLVKQIHREILKSNLADDRKMSVLGKTAEAEFRISEGASGEVQLASLLAFMGIEQG